MSLQWKKAVTCAAPSSERILKAKSTKSWLPMPRFLKRVNKKVATAVASKSTIMLQITCWQRELASAFLVGGINVHGCNLSKFLTSWSWTSFYILARTPQTLEGTFCSLLCVQHCWNNRKHTQTIGVHVAALCSMSALILLSLCSSLSA